jgi:hypothetical protein
MRFLALFVALVAFVAALSGCGDDGTETTTTADSFQVQVEETDWEGVKSGELELALEIDDHVNEEEINMRALGIFLGADGEGAPLFDFAVEANGPLNGEEIEFSSGLLVDSDRAVLNYQGQTYEPDEASFEELKSSFEDSWEDGSEADVTACRQAAEGLNLGQLVNNVTNEGKSETLDGVPVMRLSANLDIPATIDALIQMTEDPACGAQLEAVGSWSVGELEAQKKQLESAISERRVEFDIDKHGVLRRLAVDLMKVGPKGPKQEKIEIDLDLRLARVNEITELPVPSKAKTMEALAKKLGLNPLAVLEAGEGEGLIGLLEGSSGQSSGSGSS